MKEVSKTIWILNQTAGKPTSGWGERHYNLAKGWVSNGYRVYIFSGSYNHLFIQQPSVSNHIFTEENVAEGITFVWVKIPKYDGASVYKLWSMIVYMLRMIFGKTSQFPKPSIILVSSMPLFSILAGIFLKWKYRAKQLIFEIRDLWPLTPMYLSNYSSYHPIILFMKLVERAGYRKADAIVSLLPNAYSYINPISKNPAKFYYIPNGIDDTYDFILKHNTTYNYLIPSNKFIVAYTGTMGMANALSFFIEAAKLLSENNFIHFILIGDGYLKNTLEKQVKNLNNISFLPKISKNEIPYFLDKVQLCFVGRYNVPLYRYGVSYNKYFDYMLAKKPILESSEYIDSPAQLAGCAFTVSPENAEAIANAILKLSQLPSEELRVMGEKGFHYVKKYHTFEYLSKQYLNVFNASL